MTSLNEHPVWKWLAVGLALFSVAFCIVDQRRHDAARAAKQERLRAIELRRGTRSQGDMMDRLLTPAFSDQLRDQLAEQRAQDFLLGGGR